MSRATSIFETRVYEPQSKRQRDALAGQNRTPKTQTKSHQQRPIGGLSQSSTELVNPLILAGLSSTSAYQVTNNVHNGANSPMYCALCKKKFSNEATFSAHKQSDKHRKAARAANPTGGSADKEKQQAKLHPVVRGALANMKKAQAIIQDDPAVAATVFWNIAQDIASYGDDSITRSALDNALVCMDAMDKDVGRRGAKGSPSFWSARALLKTALDCRMALARLDSTLDGTRAAGHYIDALCQYLGITLGDLDMVAQTHDPLEMSSRADQVARAIPRKFAKDEDVDQAVTAMEEVAGALLAFSSASPNDPLAWRSLSAYFLLHAFALSKDKQDAAYVAIQRTVSSFDALGLRHSGCECAVLIIAHHMKQSSARNTVAASVVDSIKADDIVRARDLLWRYNFDFEEPWSRYLAKFVDKVIDADAPWMNASAWSEWRDVAGSSDLHSTSVEKLVELALRQELSPYMIYTPNPET
ncbi:hypothetical protein LPJ66_003531 [Kickxella alabastrina]|uniref:Uncharacterized protein n=1 Tax=Kickxella alabastrina TaxID=61397 RepID=A0ACC1IN06_9FUNG|nr:hypothetical protein LPJ66_003531 [Kickxella alabastrina]